MKLQEDNVDENNVMLSLMMLDKLTVEEMGSLAFELFSTGTESVRFIININMFKSPNTNFPFLIILFVSFLYK